MNADSLTVAEKEEVQLYFLRAWLCRKRRKAFAVKRADEQAALNASRNQHKVNRPRGNWGNRRRLERLLAGEAQSTT